MQDLRNSARVQQMFCDTSGKAWATAKRNCTCNDKLVLLQLTNICNYLPVNATASGRLHS